MAFNSELLAIINTLIDQKYERLTAVGTVVEWTATSAMVLFDGDALAVPVKTFRGVVAAPNHRVGLIKFGRDWTIVGSFNDPPQQDRQVFEANGTWVKPVGARQVFIQCQGGGGGGGGSAAAAAGQHSCGGGGGGGAYAERLMRASDVPDQVTVQRGAGGTVISGGNGQTGGTSRFGVVGEGGPWVGASGGFGGILAGSSAVSFGQPGGAGGAGFEGAPDLKVVGNPGGNAYGDGQLGTGGPGGGSQLGGGGVGQGQTTTGMSLDGNNGRDYGGGGGGALSTAGGAAASGGTGARGVVIITTTF